MKRCFCVCGQWYWSKAYLSEHVRFRRLFSQDQNHWEVSKAHHKEMLEDRKERKSMGQ